MRVLLVDVDTQVDFMQPDGALYVPGAELLVNQLADLTQTARRLGIPHLATLDTHTSDDPEFAAYGFPTHCVAGTAGHEKIKATQLACGVTLEQAKTTVKGTREWVFPKATFDVYTNPGFKPTVASLNADWAIVCGVATDYCVKAAVMGLLGQGVGVLLVTDAIAAVTPQTGIEAIAAMQQAGARLITTREAVAYMEAAVAHVA